MPCVVCTVRDILVYEYAVSIVYVVCMYCSVVCTSMIMMYVLDSIRLCMNCVGVSM